MDDFFHLKFEAAEFWSPLTLLTLAGIILSVWNVYIVKRQGRGWQWFLYAFAFMMVGIAMGFGYVTMEQVSVNPRIGHVVTYSAIDFLLATRIALSVTSFGFNCFKEAPKQPHTGPVTQEIISTF